MKEKTVTKYQVLNQNETDFGEIPPSIIILDYNFQVLQDKKDKHGINAEICRVNNGQEKEKISSAF